MRIRVRDGPHSHHYEQFTPTDTFQLVAPVGTRDAPACWEGRAARKPWHYKATAILPHLDTPELLETCVALLRLQTTRPYIVVCDTGSPRDVCERIEQLRGEDLEVHFIRGGSYTHSSEPVARALDLGFACVNTEFIFLTHVDVFATRRDSIAYVVDQCSEACPVVGWEMSDRSAITDEWRGMVSHTWTALHTATMLKAGVTWHFERYRIMNGTPKQFKVRGFPDTETTPNIIFRERGIVPKILGPEFNYRLQETPWWVHVRSAPGMQIYGGGTEKYRKEQPALLARELERARERIEAWASGNRTPLPATIPV